MIKNLIFDFGKVLVDYDFISFFQKIIPDAERCREFTKLLFNDQIEQELDRGVVTFDQSMQRLIDSNPQFTEEIRLFSTRYQEIVTGEVPGMYNLLSQLKAKGYHLYGLTNWCQKVYETVQNYPVFQLLDGYVVSSDVHFIKPEPDIYHCLYSKFSIKPEECLFTDDRQKNILGGAQTGMQGVVFSNATQYEQELKKLSIL
ncbi:MAG: HAD family phosphatase [Bacteroidales bacterium]|nr:HAD family phosphatase [Bacteroidales bacterium]